MIILSIETSCDDTGVTILEVKNKNSFKILADELSSQAKMHSAYGGVYPNLAKNEHTKNLPILFEKAFKKSKIKKIDLITVTYGPGLEPCLWTGITFAQEMAKKWNCPVTPVNHMEGHILSVFGKNKGIFKIPKIKFPILSLLVSGGHTELVLSTDYLKHKIIGKTLDDAAGEAFDKVARMLNLPYPGGPEISKLAEEARALRNQSLNFKFPRPMLKSKDLNFSFSGLKTSVLYFIQKNPDVLKSQIALEFENAVVETLVAKTVKAVEQYKTKTLIVAGGVSANKHLKRELRKSLKNKTGILTPTKELARDNAIMIAIAGFLQYKNGKTQKASNIKAKGNLGL